MDVTTLWRAALLQVLAVALLSIALALALWCARLRAEDATADY